MPVRNRGIDLLRVVSMVMVAVLHVLGQGGVLGATRPLSMRYEVAWLLEAAAYCAVDCYALISGYVGLGTGHRFSGLFQLCAQALFYTLGWTTALLVAHPQQPEPEMLLGALLPFAGTYWYLTAYFCLFFFMPHLDAMVEGLSDDGVRGLALSVLLVFSLLPTALRLLGAPLGAPTFGADLAKPSGGYSFVWLAALYVLGACMRRGNMTVDRRQCVAAYLTCVAATWGWMLAADALNASAGIGPMDRGLLLSYTSPTVVGAAVALVMLFSQLQIRGRLAAIAGFFAPLSFGVYLWHVEPIPWNRFVKGSFACLADARAPWMALMVLACAAGIWLVGSLVDWARVRAFSLLRVRLLCDWLGARLDVALLRGSERAE